METTKKTACIYARVSSVGDRQNTQRQITDLQNYAGAMNYQVIEEFSEHISGAAKNEDRTVLNDCLNYCFTNSINTLLISELSRLGRDVDELLANVKKCKDNGLNVYFQKESISILQADGKENPYLTIMIAVLGTCAAMERENIAYRLNSGRNKYIADGGKLGRKEGYRKSKEDKAKQYKGVIKRLKNGEKIRDIAELEKCNPSTVQRIKKEFEL